MLSCAILCVLACCLSPLDSAQTQTLSPPTQTSAAATPQTTPLPSATPLLLLDVTVMDDKGRYVTGLSANEIKVLDDKTPQPLAFFSTAEAPASIGLVLDWSGPTKGRRGSHRLDAAIPLIRRLVEHGHPESEYLIVGFSPQPQIIMDWARDPAIITSGLERLGRSPAKGTNAFYDACYLAIDKVMRGSHRKRVLLLMTDGSDNGSTFKLGELKRLVRESDVLIYALFLADPEIPESSFLIEAAAAELSQLVIPNGGQVLFPRSNAEVAEAFERIWLELRSQYTIGIVPTPAHVTAKERTWRRLKIEARLPPKSPLKSRLRARTREGYFAAPTP